MAIIGPKDLPKVLKVDSNPLKLRMLHHFGHPNVNVELTETQMEELLRVSGDFICQYFANEERYAYFYTQPLVESYDLPEDAYWVREIAWDPTINRINDIFGAEMFLFCIAASDSKILTENGLKFHEDVCANEKLVTPYGFEEFVIEYHDDEQPLLEIVYDCGSLKCTTNQPVKIDNFDCDNSLDGWINASELSCGDILVLNDGKSEIGYINNINAESTITIKTPSGCFFACSDGEPVLIH